MEALAAARGWKHCPHCTRRVEKVDGCNHIRCRCGTSFCYTCGAALTTGYVCRAHG